MSDRFKYRMWSTNAGRYFDETNDAMLENVFECMKQQICYDCQNPVFRKIYDRISYNHIADGMVFEQCTGLKDKNGKLIYEGDIISNKEYLHEIVWNKDDASFHTILKGMRPIVCGHIEQIWIDEFEYEVIGNIHENKELLDD